MASYEPKVTLDKIFTNNPNFPDEGKEALKIYSRDEYYPIINRLSRNTSLISTLYHTIGKYLDIRQTSKKEGKVANIQHIPYPIYQQNVETAEKTLPILQEIFKNPYTVTMFPVRISLYRGIDNNYKKPLIDRSTTYYEDKAFTSTSFSLDFVINFKLDTGFKTKLYLLPNIEYRLVSLTEGLTIHPHEQEVLLNRGCIYVYIGNSDYKKRIINENEVITELVPLYEFILLPNIETYHSIGHANLKLMGEGIHEDYMNILKSIDLYEENTKFIIKDASKTTYISELEYLLQSSATNFIDEALKLQMKLFNKTDRLSLETFFTQKQIITKQMDYFKLSTHYMNTNEKLKDKNAKIMAQFNELLKSMEGGGSKHLNASIRFQFYQNYLRSK